MTTTNSKKRKNVVEPSPQIKKEIYKPIGRNIYFNGYSYRFRLQTDGEHYSHNLNLDKTTSYWVNILFDSEIPLKQIIWGFLDQIGQNNDIPKKLRRKFEDAAKDFLSIYNHKWIDYYSIILIHKSLNGNNCITDDEFNYSVGFGIFNNIDLIIKITKQFKTN